MQTRQQITLGFAPTDIIGRYTILIDGKPRYLGKTFDRHEVTERIEWLERSCDITFDDDHALPAAGGVSINRTYRAARLKENIMAKATKKATAPVAQETPESNDGKRARTAKPTLPEMIAQGILKAGTKISAFYRGSEVTGTIRADGTVRLASKDLKAVDGQEYGSLSDAGRAVCFAAGNEKPSINGYTFFGTKNAEGKVVAISTLRQ